MRFLFNPARRIRTFARVFIFLHPSAQETSVHEYSTDKTGSKPGGLTSALPRMLFIPGRCCSTADRFPRVLRRFRGSADGPSPPHDPFIQRLLVIAAWSRSAPCATFRRG